MSHLAVDRAAPVRVLPYLPPLLAAGLRVVLIPHQDEVTVLSASSQAPDVIVFDPMYDGIGPRLERSGDVPLLAMTGATGSQVVATAHRYGASRILDLTCPTPEIVTTLREAATGDAVREREVYATEFGGVLSAREADVIALVSQGLSNQEISAELFLGINTIKTYIRTAYRKMGVKSRSQAVLWGLERGMALRVRA